MSVREDSPWDTNAVKAFVEVAALAKNKVAYTQLANCMRASCDVGYIRQGISKAWPNGLSSAVIKCMFGCYKPDNATALAKCQARLMPLKLGAKADSSDLFVKIAEIKAQYKSATYTIDHHLIVSTDRVTCIAVAPQVGQGSAMTMHCAWCVYVTRPYLAIWWEQKMVRDVMVVLPAIEKQILNLIVSCFLNTKLQSILGPSTIVKHRILFIYGQKKSVNLVVVRHYHSTIWIFLQHPQQQSPSKAHPKRKMTSSYTKHKL
jgi:hypothetical protein